MQDLIKRLSLVVDRMQRLVIYGDRSSINVMVLQQELKRLEVDINHLSNTIMIDLLELENSNASIRKRSTDKTGFAA